MSRMSLHYDFVKQPSLQAQIGPTLSLTRATPGTVMDASGYLKRVAAGQPRFTGASHSENLVLQSEDFTTTWATTNATVRANAAIAPNGSRTADAIVDNATAGEHNVNQSVANCPYGLYAYSCYLKAGTRTWARLRCGGQNAFFDLANGAVGTTDSGVTATIKDVGGGWYRCTHIRYLPSTGTLTPVINPAEADNDTTYSGDSTEAIYAWGAQLELASAASTYKPTTTAAVFDAKYTDTIASHVERKGLLIEEARTNLQVYSEAFDNAAWTKIRSVINTGYAIAPDGSSTACQLVDDSSTGTNNIRVEDSAVTATSTAYTHSVFAKADTLTWLLLEVAGSGTQSVFAYLDLSNGAVGNTGADNVSEGIEDAGNGWYRCWISYVSDSVDTSIVNRVYAAVANGDIVVDLDGTSSILIWGYQMEVGSFPTSYIPTTTASVARDAELYTTTDVSWLNADNDEGTVFTKASQVATGDQLRLFGVYKSAAQRAVDIYTKTNNAVESMVYKSGFEMLVTTAAAAITNGTSFTHVTAWDSTDPSMGSYIDGASSTPDTTGDPTITLDTATTALGYYQPGPSNYFTGHVEEVAYWPAALSATECSTMSAWGLVGAMQSNEITRQHNSVNAVHNKLTRQHRDPTLRHNR